MANISSLLNTIEVGGLTLLTCESDLSSIDLDTARTLTGNAQSILGHKTHDNTAELHAKFTIHALQPIIWRLTNEQVSEEVLEWKNSLTNKFATLIRESTNN